MFAPSFPSFLHEAGGTIWLFNIAMENGPFTDDFPIKTTMYSGFSMAMLVITRWSRPRHVLRDLRMQRAVQRDAALEVVVQGTVPQRCAARHVPCQVPMHRVAGHLHGLRSPSGCRGRSTNRETKQKDIGI